MGDAVRRRDLLTSVVPAAVGGLLPGAAWGGAAASDVSGSEVENDRSFWLGQMDRVARPVMQALSRGRLRAEMPVEAAKGQEESRREGTHLEAFARTLCGMAPWLEHGPSDGDEGRMRSEYVRMAREAMAQGVRRGGPDYLNFGKSPQTLVDAGFLALAVLRAPRVLNAELGGDVRRQLALALREVRSVTPPFNNWLLFAAAVEAALCALGEPCDRMRVDYALRQMKAWYAGDGVYGDGPQFHADYYNSFVMQPFLLAVMEAVGDKEPAWKAMMPEVRRHAVRYAEIQERMIAPDGTYPVIGRSMAYRCGAFQLLADVALRGMLPEEIAPEQVRCALAAVMRRTLGAKGSFDAKGWLRIGLAGSQPGLGETYISTGSLYLCAAVFLPLGLGASDRFWAGAATTWSSQRVWAGEDMRADHAIEG